MRGCVVSQLQRAIKEGRTNQKPLSLSYDKGYSNTTRSKTYKNGSLNLDCSALNQILFVDTNNRIVRAHPRVTMEQLVRTTLTYGLIPAVVPEFKGITVGGAIMGGAAESSSHTQGIFHDSCNEIQLLDGRGELIIASPRTNTELFYGISGSYGSLGLLTSADIQLIPSQRCVNLSYHRFSEPQQALSYLKEQIGHALFLDGIIFSKNHAVVVEGNFTDAPATVKLSTWFVHHLKTTKHDSETLSVWDYLFRYDQGAFWMGSFLFSPRFLGRYLLQGVLNGHEKMPYFSADEIARFHKISFPHPWVQQLFSPWMPSQKLWALLHRAEKWVQNRLLIQDFCIPLPQSAPFLSDLLEDPAIFPLWLCPIKGDLESQFLAPHHAHPFLINFGVYGVPAYSAPMSRIMKNLETKTAQAKGRKVLYSHSYYTEEEFWQIYSRPQYEKLREQTHAQGVWRGLTEKVLSE